MNLKPARLTNENLVQSLRRLTNDFSSNTLVVTTFESDIENIDGLSSEMVNTFYLICKEALANVTKHARATEVTVSFKEKEQGYELEVSDNGVGFNPVHDRRSSSHGINNILARAKGLRGNFDIQSAVGKGTMLTVFLPKNHSEQHEQAGK
jgi:signal transduction histidine kinase